MSHDYTYTNIVRDEVRRETMMPVKIICIARGHHRKAWPKIIKAQIAGY